MQQLSKYKKTEFGEIPEVWDQSSLLDFVESKNDIVAGPFGSNLKVSDYKNDGVPIIRLQNIERNEFINKNIKYISKEKAYELKYHSYKPHDIVLAKLGDPIGKTCIVPEYVKGGIVVADVVRIRPSLKKTDTRFLEYALNSEYCSKQMNGSFIGTTRPRVNLDQIRYLKLLKPPLKEQQKIASILSNVDLLIHKTDQIIEQTRILKKGLMQRLLTKGIGHTKFKKTKLGEIPEDWHLIKLDSICRKIIDGTHFTPKYLSEGIPFLRITDIQQKTIDWKNTKKISLHEHEELTKRCKPEIGDVLLSKNGTVGITKVIDWEKPFSIFVSLCLIKPIQEKIKNLYLEYILPSDLCFKQIKKRSKQGTVTNLHLEEIRELLIPLPSLLEQQKITSILTNLDDLIQKQQADKLNQETLKKGLMQQLLTGKIRVKV